MLSHPEPSTASRFWQLPSAEQCPVPTNRWDAFYTVQGVIVDVLGAESLTVTRNESLELLGCHWYARCTPSKNIHLSPIPLPTEWSICQIGIKKRPLTALLKCSPAVLKSSILSCWQALRLDISRHALLVVGVVRYTTRIKRTPTHQYNRYWRSGPRKHEQSYH